MMNTLIIIAIVVATIFAISVLSKNKSGRSIILYFISGLLIFVGLISGINLFKEMTSKSYINGNIETSNSETSEIFKYSSSNISFYDDLYDDYN